MTQGNSNQQTVKLELRTFYELDEPASFAQVNRHRTRRLLEAHGVQFMHVGRALYVPLSEMHEKIPPLWKSLCSAYRARRRGERELLPGEGSARKGSR